MSFQTFNFNPKNQIYSQNKQVNQVEQLKKSWFQWENVVICRWTLTPSATWCYYLWIWQGPKLQQYVITFDSSVDDIIFYESYEFHNENYEFV